MPEAPPDLFTAATAYARGDEKAAGAINPARPELGEEAEQTTRQVLKRVFERGWLPDDLYELARRRFDEFGTSYLLDSLAIYVDPYAPETVDARWLEGLDAKVWWSRTEPHLGQWAAKQVLIGEEVVAAVIEVLGQLLRLPTLNLILSLPGTVRKETAHVHHGVDEKKLGRVRALLAKAESSSFPEEAEALTGKAQELMTRYALDRALVEAETGVNTDAFVTRRLWLETPHLDAKSLLVQVVSAANRCRALFHGEFGFVSVLGDEDDVDAVLLLTTSLLLQATKATLASGKKATRAYRKSFLVAYASRIGERLEQARMTITAGQPSLLPVLATHQAKVDETFERVFPAKVGKRVSVRSGEGWEAGRAAADQATLDG
ncbi:DUF2786 domain-containing protein [Amycolatopsis sp. H20-H5]|uniref:DUF2786 domain-containing protein n=1 Tax=Amycolatopsis sp. H20-H5 TaxID=3046309 RepID=UPI002DB7CE23|nr:DUF2786 domain-containing protein [Amycolatopsis sp. H20-H5]MEC3976340.1 DUF2786 domain-containing protein [Amycolatopsis sp. H20-H5]